MRHLRLIFLTSALCQCTPATKRHTDSTIYMREQAEIRELNSDKIGKTLL